RTHLRQIGALAAQERAILRAAIRRAATESVNPFCHVDLRKRMACDSRKSDAAPPAIGAMQHIKRNRHGFAELRLAGAGSSRMLSDRFPAYPLWATLPVTAYVAVLIPVYWNEYGPGNFLWFSDIALFAVL